MNPTNPARPNTESTRTSTPGPQPFGTWFGRWHHIYTDAPATVATLTEPSTSLPRRTALTVAA